MLPRNIDRAWGTVTVKLGTQLVAARALLGEDFWSYGLEANRPALAAIGRFVHEQGLSPRAVSPDELFASGVE